MSHAKICSPSFVAMRNGATWFSGNVSGLQERLTIARCSCSWRWLGLAGGIKQQSVVDKVGRRTQKPCSLGLFQPFPREESYVVQI